MAFKSLFLAATSPLLLLSLSSLLPQTQASPLSTSNSNPASIHTTYSACQHPTTPPLLGCPPGTLYVSPSANPHTKNNFRTIQSAISSLPHDDSSHTILIASGSYTEQLNITRLGPLTLLGETSSPLLQSSNKVTVLFASADNNSSLPDDAYSSVLTVASNLNASLTGSGPTGFPIPAGTPPGNRDFRVYNVDFRNTYNDYSDGPALAVSVSGCNASFYQAGFYSYQDTVSFSFLPII